MGRHGQCEKRAFKLLKMRKKNQLKHKNQERKTRIIDSYVLEYERLYLSLRGDHIKDKSLHYCQ